MAFAGVELDQVPPLVLFDNWVVELMQTDKVPVIVPALGLALTVTAVIVLLVQPCTSVTV